MPATVTAMNSSAPPPRAAPDATALARLLQLASPSLPVGAYSYSEGLEYAVHTGWVHDAETLRTWLHDGLLAGAAHLEAAVLVRVYDAWACADPDAATRWDEWLSASRETEELRSQSENMGRALLRLLAELGPTPVQEAARAWRGRRCNFVSAFALAAAGWGIAREATLTAYLHGWAANLVSAGVKLVPLGQTAGQQLLWALQDDIARAAEIAAGIDDEDLGVASWGLALASMAHETQYSRLFRS